ncbi:unnamed protein product, partial [Mesorhabditis belari]|uniref:Vitellogenin domain-containing protein n=1 Tax=Mesorhabditis belari TaxID=2138241 RepID=A0AAF3ENK9_9BILA
MKLLVAFGLVAAALASWESSPIYQGSERSFVKGNTYIFSYDGQAVSGVAAKGSSSHSIQQASGKVYVTVGDKYWTMRGDDIKLTYGQRKMEEPRTFEKLTSLEQQQLTDEQIAILRLPVRFRYHQGIITDVHFTERDNAWSENMKRSVLSMLQMQLSPKTPQAQEFSTVGEKEIDENNKYFTQAERVLEGECEVAYTIVDGEKKDEKEITKSLNFNKCSKRVDIRYGFRFNSECETCLEEDARPESQVVVNYKVMGDDKSFLIKEINLKSEYLFTPFSTQQQMLATYQHVIMRLIKIVETERSEEAQWSNKKSTIMYNYEKELAREQFWMNGDEESWKSAGFEFMPKKEIVEKAVQQMIESIDESDKDGVKLESTHQMARIVIVLRMCNREEMMDIHRTVCENSKYTKEQQKKINEIIADALAIAGTKVTVEHLMEKIEKKQISPLKAALTLKSLDIIYSKSEETILRSTAVDALRMIREEMPRKESVNPCEKQLSNDVTVVLRSLRFRPSLESRHFHASTFSKALDLGLTIDFASVLTNESVLPRKRSPLWVEETREWELDCKAELVFPESPKSIRELREQKHQPEYAVLMKNTKKNSEEKKLKIVTAENKEIEIEFEIEKEKLVCKIDGSRVEDEETLSENGIELIGERTLEVVLPKIAVRFDGYMCEIKADKRTQNKQCGMCGHFDGHRDNEFRRADNEETEDLEDFHRSWLKKDSECEIEEYKLKEKTNYGVEENKESTEFDSEEDDFERVKKVKKMHKKIDYKDEEEETYEPIEKTIVIERSSKTCFSVEPQPACRHSDEPQETTQKKVKLACLPRGERKTREMINMIKNEQYDEVSRLVNNLEERFTESIRVPTLCRVF